jgi:hypothetical protein
MSSWGIPNNNGWLGFILVGIIFVTVAIYIRYKEIFVSLFMAEFLLFIFMAVGLVPGWMLVFPVVMGMGVWALERSFQ